MSARAAALLTLLSLTLVAGHAGGQEAVCMASTTPDLAVCAAPGAGASEMQALQRVACLLDALNRWKLQVVACLQARVDGWQAQVMWPVSGLRMIGGALRRMRTLRDEVEGLRGSWVLDPKAEALAALYSQPVLASRSTYDSAWGASTGVSRDVQDLLAWHSAHTRNALQARTNGDFGRVGELPEATWERIGREGPALVDQQRDALTALRLVPQMQADRLRVEGSTTRLAAQALVTRQLHRDLRRLQARRPQHLGALMLDTLTGADVQP